MPARRSKDVPVLSRVILHVGDVTEAARFYAKLLGVEGRPAGGGRVYFDCGPVILAILDPGETPRPSVDIVYFTVKSAAKIHARARRLDCLDPQRFHEQPAGKLSVRPWGEKSFYVVDPWGNGLCFIEQATFFRAR